MGYAINTSVFLSFVSFLTVGTFGYLSFLENTQDDFVKSYPTNDILIDIFRVTLALLVMLTFPVAAFPCR